MTYFNNNYMFNLPNYISVPQYFWDFTIPTFDFSNYSAFNLPNFEEFNKKLNSIINSFAYPNSSNYSVFTTENNSASNTNRIIPIKNNYLVNTDDSISENNNYSATTNTYVPAKKSNTVKTSYSTSRKKTVSPANTNIIKSDYQKLSQKEARKQAAQDPNLECLANGGKRWHISKSDFVHDIEYARKGTGKILDKVAALIGENLIVTSALATGEKGSPHGVKDGYCSHYNNYNPKLDFHGNQALANKLMSTGYFSHVLYHDGHIDAQIDINKYLELENKSFEAIS